MASASYLAGLGASPGWLILKNGGVIFGLIENILKWTVAFRDQMFYDDKSVSPLV